MIIYGLEYLFCDGEYLAYNEVGFNEILEIANKNKSPDFFPYIILLI